MPLSNFATSFDFVRPLFLKASILVAIPEFFRPPTVSHFDQRRLLLLYCVVWSGWRFYLKGSNQSFHHLLHHLYFVNVLMLVLGSRIGWRIFFSDTLELWISVLILNWEMVPRPDLFCVESRKFGYPAQCLFHVLDIWIAEHYCWIIAEHYCWITMDILKYSSTSLVDI